MNFSISWYYGKIRRLEAESLLLQEPHDGAFLIRDSESTAGKEVQLLLFDKNICVDEGCGLLL